MLFENKADNGVEAKEKDNQKMPGERTTRRLKGKTKDAKVKVM
jgi:hypothetical protein